MTLDATIARLKAKRGPDEIDRVRELLRRPAEPCTDRTEFYARAGGRMRLHPLQSWALREIAERGGLLGAIAVGAGKGLISMLAPLAISHGPRGPSHPRTLILIPAKLRGTYAAERAKFSPHFYLHPATVMSSSELSRPESAHKLEELAPELIVCDEVHSLRNPTATRTKRVARFLKAHPETAFVGLSGTITSRSILDYAHLLEWALSDGSPLPRAWLNLESIANCVDVGKVPGPQDMGTMRRLMGTKDYSQGEARKWMRDRIRQTSGVVSSVDGSVGASLTLEELKCIDTPPGVESALAVLSETWESPCGQELYSDAMRVAEVERCIAQGFYYRWIWPDGVPDLRWLWSRKEWSGAVRDALKRAPAGYDSPALLTRACERGDFRTSELEGAWSDWKTERLKPEPKSEAIWISHYLIFEALRWLDAQKRPAIVWYRHTAVGAALERVGVPTFGAGTEPPKDAMTCALSIAAHGTGKNLQAWDNQLILCPPSSGAAWEQLLGRTHRQGQESDEVEASVVMHLDAFKSAMRKAREAARYIVETTEQQQKLLTCAVR